MTTPATPPANQAGVFKELLVKYPEFAAALSSAERDIASVPGYLSRMLSWFRMSGWGFVAVAALAAVAFVSAEQLPVALWKFAQVASGGFLGYWLDRHLFPYARPDKLGAEGDPHGIVFASAMLRRAAIVAATIVAVGIAM